MKERTRALTPVQNQALTYWVMTTFSAAEIAELTGLSRNSVIGLAHRMQKRCKATSRAHMQAFYDGRDIKEWDEPPLVTTVFEKSRFSTRGPAIPDPVASRLDRNARERERRSLLRATEKQRDRQSAELREKARQEAAARAEQYRVEQVLKEARSAESVASVANAEDESVANGADEDYGPHQPNLFDLRDWMCKAIVGHHPERGNLYCGTNRVKQGWCQKHALQYLTRPYTKSQMQHKHALRFG